MTGTFKGTVDFGGGPLASAGLFDIFVAKFSTNGDHIWSQSFGDSGFQSGISITTDPSGNVLVTGRYTGTVDFGGGPLTSGENRDIFVVKFWRDPSAVPEGPQTLSHLLGAFPNPFNPNTSVFFTIDQAQEVRIEIYNVMGWSIAVIVDQTPYLVDCGPGGRWFQTWWRPTRRLAVAGS